MLKNSSLCILFIPLRKELKIDMKTILVIGAGLSSSSLIRYLLDHSESNNWQIRVVDQNLELVKKKINGHKNGIALSFNALDQTDRKTEIQSADLVISMLPARFHVEIAKDCIAYKTNLITPSYVSEEMRALDSEAREAGVLIMNEIGVDPGIDHMSAMRIIDGIRKKGGKMHSFKSFTGGLVAPESDDNPWNYKFTWNPRNVVLAGQGTAACFIKENKYKYLTYNQLFKRIDRIHIDGFGDFDGYANRDSLSYRSIYGLENIPTIYRGTLRRKGYCEAWNVFVELGITDDSYVLLNSENLTPRTFINSFLAYHPTDTVEYKFKQFLGESRLYLFDKFKWLGFFDDGDPIGLERATPAQLLEKVLVQKMLIGAHDKDMLVMHHEFIYHLNGNRHVITSHMVNIGEDGTYTSMSNTVGLPVGICAKMILLGDMDQVGIQRPISPEIYNPILDELESFDIQFIEQELVTEKQ
jgi:saccharopine dehydrogenase-like NADP-dependent oxidoreductase